MVKGKKLILELLDQHTPQSLCIDDLSRALASADIDRKETTRFVRELEASGHIFRWEIEGREWVSLFKEAHNAYYLEAMPKPSAEQARFESITGIGRLKRIARTPLFRPCGDIYTDFEETFSRYRMPGHPENLGVINRGVVYPQSTVRKA